MCDLFDQLQVFHNEGEQWHNCPLLKCQVVKFDKSLRQYTLPVSYNSFKLLVQVYFMFGFHQIVTTVLLSLHRTDISLYRGKNWWRSHSLWNSNIKCGLIIFVIFYITGAWSYELQVISAPGYCIMTVKTKKKKTKKKKNRTLEKGSIIKNLFRLLLCLKLLFPYFNIHVFLRFLKTQCVTLELKSLEIHIFKPLCFIYIHFLAISVSDF